jgi:hypothetical protein
MHPALAPDLDPRVARVGVPVTGGGTQSPAPAAIRPLFYWPAMTCSASLCRIKRRPAGRVSQPINAPTLAA